MNEKEIGEMSKALYKKKVKDLINKSVFKFYMNLKTNSLKIRCSELFKNRNSRLFNKYQVKNK